MWWKIETMKTALRKIRRQIFGPLEDHYWNQVKSEIGETCESLLDVGCGVNSPIQCFNPRLKYTVGLDAFPAAIEKSRALGIHDEYQLMDALDISEHFAHRSFECVLAADILEHLTEQEGLHLIAQMEAIARSKVIICTPNGFLAQRDHSGNPLQRHLSGWTVKKMESLGYRVIGIHGLKWLRGEEARPRWWPSWFWSTISLLTQSFTATRPQWALSILCIKDVKVPPDATVSPGGNVIQPKPEPAVPIKENVMKVKASSKRELG